MGPRTRFIFACSHVGFLEQYIWRWLLIYVSVETFLQMFCRFMAQKSLMLSDNASTFVSAAKELERLFESDKLEESLGTKTGLMVLGKAHRHNQNCTEESSREIIHYIESTTDIGSRNQRSSVDVCVYRHTYPELLTASHLLYGRCITTLPHSTIEGNEVNDHTFLTSPMLHEKNTVIKPGEKGNT